MDNSEKERGSGDGQESVQEQARLLAASALDTRAEEVLTLPNTNDCISNWKPNSETLKQLTEMGFNENLARKALFYTSSENIEVVVNWMIESDPNTTEIPLEMEIAQESYRQTLSKPAITTEISNDILKGEDFKMSFVVNTTLQMGVGKVAAQVAHAALNLYRKMLAQPVRFEPALLQWNEMGETKIVLRGDSVDQLRIVQEKANTLGLPTALIRDAGRTQIPSGSTTVVGVFGNRDDLRKITGHLKLL